MYIKSVKSCFQTDHEWMNEKLEKKIKCYFLVGGIIWLKLFKNLKVINPANSLSSLSSYNSKLLYSKSKWLQQKMGPMMRHTSSVYNTITFNVSHFINVIIFKLFVLLYAVQTLYILAAEGSRLFISFFNYLNVYVPSNSFASIELNRPC